MFDFTDIHDMYDAYNIDSGWLHQVDELKILLNPDWKHIAVNMSGGADSALGTCLLAKLITENGYDTKVTVITHVRVWKTRPWAGPVSVDVYNKVKSMFPNIIGDRIQNYVAPELETGVQGHSLIEVKPGQFRSGDGVVIDSFNNWAIHNYNIEAVYNFITRNPKELDDPKKPHNRNDDPHCDVAICPNFDTLYSETAPLVQPFKFVEKDWIIAEYYRNNWIELLNTTRSCEADANKDIDGKMLEDYKTYKHGVSELWPCESHCFWCNERNWAIESAKTKLGIK